MKALKVKDSLQEGVGDKYAAKFGIPDDTEERKVQGTDEQIISRDGDWKLLKNPRSLDSLGSSVRGVIIPRKRNSRRGFYKKMGLTASNRVWLFNYPEI